MSFSYGTEQPAMGPGMLNDLFSAADLSPMAQKHVVRVSTTLAGCAALSALGAYLDMTTALFHFSSPIAPVFLSLGAIMAVTAIRPTKENEGKRLFFLGAFAFFKGNILAPLLEHLLNYYPTVIPSALATTSILFLSLAVSAMLSSRRLGMYMGALVGTIMTFLSIASIGRIFFGMQLFLTTELYLGLFMFCGYVIYDTQMMLAKTEAGILDVPGDAANLYVDLVAIFIRIAVLLMKQQDRERKQERRSKRRD